MIVFPLDFSLHILDKQPQCICPIQNILQCYFCILVEMSGMHVNWGQVPHGLDTSLDS